MRISVVILISWLTLGATTLWSDEPPPPTTRRQYQAILDDFEAGKRAFASKFETATTEAQRRKFRAQFPGPDDYYARLLALAEAHPADPAAVDALVWIVATSTNGYDAFKERGVRIKRAMDILASDHLDDPRLGRVCLELSGAATPLRDEFLHTIYARSTDRRNKGRACLWRLGEFLLAKSAADVPIEGPLRCGGDDARQSRIPPSPAVLRAAPSRGARHSLSPGRTTTGTGDRRVRGIAV